jgi:hypothetical protein
VQVAVHADCVCASLLCLCPCICTPMHLCRITLLCHAQPSVLQVHAGDLLPSSLQGLFCPAVRVWYQVGCSRGVPCVQCCLGSCVTCCALSGPKVALRL